VRQERTSNALELSVIIPAHNEAARILPSLRSIVHYLTERARTFEIIVVDDGSLDDTTRIVNEFARQVPCIRLIRLPTCAGKGAAVRHGMQAARGRWQLFTDADGATPITELGRLEQALAGGAVIAIGSRSLASRRADFTVNARWHRSLLGSVFNAIVKMRGITGIADTQCGFKLFDRAVAQDLFSVCCLNGYGFDLELLFVAQHRGYRIAEVPVNWTDQPGSKVRPLRDGLGMLRELIAIHRNAEKGLYSNRGGSRELSPVTSSSAVLKESV
jgi:dolichyl-phosphate beta-glucosyltransferase